MSGNLNALQAPPIRPVAQDTSTGNFVPLQSTGGALVVTGGGGAGGGNVVVTSGTLTAITNTVAVAGTLAVNNFPATQAVSGTLTGITNGVTLASGVNNVGTVAISGGTLTVGGTTKVVSGSLYNLGGGTTYSNGVVIGSSASPGGTGLVSVTGVFRAGATSGLLQTLSLVSSDAQTTASMNGVVWAHGIPTSSTVTDHTAISVSAADAVKKPSCHPPYFGFFARHTNCVSGVAASCPDRCADRRILYCFCANGDFCFNIHARPFVVLLVPLGLTHHEPNPTRGGSGQPEREPAKRACRILEF